MTRTRRSSAAPRSKSSNERSRTGEDETSPTDFVLRLYVSGMSGRSRRAIENITSIAQEHLKGHCHLEVIDLCQCSSAAQEEQIVAVPTLIRKLPLPLRRLIGDLSDKDRVLLSLDLGQDHDKE